MKPTPTTDTWPTRDSQEDARGLPGRPDDAHSGITGAAGGKPGSQPSAEKKPTRSGDTLSSEDDNLGAD
ncbi:hypothetical protein [Pseudomonas sp. RIT-PI-S]|uniref:hypothetical protein n=1 Tax=Pseudomonas sp. RIT-PI-S TaxID=3035295 RepID=UPI0021D9787F|nr:hypothetical protein [Pseudomonas sp. RIT-PI-S]